MVSLPQICEALNAGRPVALPSETVYGLAGNAYLTSAIQEIFRIKGRPATNPLIVHYRDAPSASIDVHWTEMGRLLADCFWPGPLTLILERREESRLSPLVSAGFSSVGVRVPSHPLFQEVLKALSFPLAAPSANPSGFLSPTQVAHITESFSDTLVVDGGSTIHGLESSVVDVRFASPMLLRPGAITRQDIEEALGEPVKIPEQKATLEQFYSPGLHPHHYAPRKPLRLNVTDIRPGEGQLGFGQNILNGGQPVLNLSPQGSLKEAARNLFTYLHHLDNADICQTIAVVPIPSIGLGEAICDRLIRAATS
jgi:L-threonylcarbamoyladenylate synthase